MRVILGFGALMLIGCFQQQDTSAVAQPTNVSADSPPQIQMDDSAMISACLTPEEQRQPPETMPLPQRRERLGCMQAVAVQQIKGQLPRAVGPITQLTDVTSDGPILIYHQTIDVDLETLPPDAAQEMEERFRATACSTTSMRRRIDIGGGFGYRWAAKDGRLIHAIVIDNCTGR